MSAVASAFIVPRSALTDVREAARPRRSLFGKPRDRFREVLASRGREVGTYAWSGHILATLLPYLDERGIALMNAEGLDDLGTYLSEMRRATVLFLTSQHQRWLPELDPARFDKHELARFHDEFNETDGEDAGTAMLEGVKFLRQVVTELDAASVALIVIG